MAAGIKLELAGGGYGWVAGDCFVRGVECVIHIRDGGLFTSKLSHLGKGNSPCND